jgi:uncharacterized protein YkwD
MAIWLLTASLLFFCFPSLASAAGFPGEVRPEDLEPRDPSVSSTYTVPPSRPGYLYTVQPGDDVFIIALAHGIPMEELVAANDLADPYVIHPDETLWVPAAPNEVSEDLRQAQVVIPPAPPEPEPEPVLASTGAAAGAGEVTGEDPEAGPSGAVAATEALTTTVAAEPATPAATPEAAAELAAAVPAVESPAHISDGARLILDLMNEKRVANGLAPLRWSDQLAQAAQAHAADCAQRGWGSHVGSDGASLRTRLARVDAYPGWASENWANARSAQQAFEMWWFEPPYGPHRLNILGSSYDEVGIGIVAGGWGYYVVADFGGN